LICLRVFCSVRCLVVTCQGLGTSSLIWWISRHFCHLIRSFLFISIFYHLFKSIGFHFVDFLVTFFHSVDLAGKALVLKV
jgi:hypothetical protein